MNLVSMKKNYNKFSEKNGHRWPSAQPYKFTCEYSCSAKSILVLVSRVYPWETSNSHSRVISVRVFHTSLPAQLTSDSHS